MTNLAVLHSYFPSEWMENLLALSIPEQNAIQEIRLRADSPITVSTPTGERFLDMARLTTLHQNSAIICRRKQLEDCFLRFCEESVYAHEQELREGYIAVAGGIRVGVAGTAVSEEFAVRSVRQVTSLCVRLPRRHNGCAASLMPFIDTCDGVCSTLLVGEPSSGKTSLLRDIASTLAARRVRVTVVDERGELGGVEGLCGCDVLRGYPKAVGILQAVRCLAPQVVIFDELGDESEQQAVCACAHAGAAVIASLHGNSPHTLQKKPSVRRLIEQDVFSRWVFLRGRSAPSEWRECLVPEVENGEIYWCSVDSNGGRGVGSVLLPTFASAR